MMMQQRGVNDVTVDFLKYISKMKISLVQQKTIQLINSLFFVVKFHFIKESKGHYTKGTRPI